MVLFKEFVPYRVTKKPCVVTFGTFDGVHLGHQFIFQKVIEKAKATDAHSALLTFQNHPAEVLRPGKVPLQLATREEKMTIIDSFGFDIVIDILFTKQIANLSADEFLERLLLMLPIACLVVGEDVAFGRDRQGNKEYLIEKARKLDIELEFIKKITIDNIPVSSSRIRALIEQSEIEKASRLLGYQLRLVKKQPGES
jgi:riboflavin kinase/FMN adenylyltransferase